MLRPEIDSTNMRRLVREMKNLNPELRKAFVDGLKKDLQPMANELAEMVPKQPPLSGMAHKGRTGWNSSIKGTAYVTPSGRNSLARIEIFGRGAQKAALKIADLAGTKMTYVKGRQGLNFINNLNAAGYPLWKNRGGRFVWAGFMKMRPQMLHFAEKTLEKYSALINKRVYGLAA